MLGEQLGESAGKVTGARVLSTEGQNSKVEVSFQGRGTLLGMEITDLGTYWQVIKPGGIIHGEGKVLMLTPEGDMAPWTGFGIGHPTGPIPAASYAVCGYFDGASERLARLNGVAIVIEYEVDGEWNYRWRLWEWKGPAS